MGFRCVRPCRHHSRQRAHSTPEDPSRAAAEEEDDLRLEQPALPLLPPLALRRSLLRLLFLFLLTLLPASLA